jgi:hypothetical protein
VVALLTGSVQSHGHSVVAWITALSTIGLFLAAVVAGLIAYRTLGTQRERERRAQAERIGAWTATLGIPLGQFGLCLLNDSSLPVTDVDILIVRRTGQSERQHYYVLPPGFFFAAWQSDKAHGTGAYDRPRPIARHSPDLLPTTLGESSSNVAYFSFVDASGLSWQRNLKPKLGEPSLIRLPRPSASPD